MRAWISARFYRKLTLALGATLIFAMGVVNYLVVRSARVHLTDQRRRGLELGAERAAAGLDAAPLSPRGGARARAFAADVSRDCACRAELLGPEGEVLADSGVPAPGAFLGPDQARDAAKGGAPFLYVARPFAGGKGTLRLTASESSIDHHVRELRGATLGVTLCALVLALLLSLVLTRPLSRPIAEMSRAARTLARGDYGARVAVLSSDELGELGVTLNQLAGTVQSHVEALSREKSHLAGILENMVEAVIAVDGGGVITAANPAMRTVLGMSAERLLGARFEEALVGGAISGLLERTLADGRARSEEVSPAQSAESTFEAHAAALTSGGRRTGALLVLHDVTRVRRLELMSREFVANASHEMRTPLSSISAFAEILSHGALDDKSRRVEFVDEIRDSAGRLSRLVDDLLDLSALESGRRAPALAPAPVAELLAEAAVGLRASADLKGVSLALEADPGLPPVRADAGQLKRALANLIDNAVKFSPAGGRVTVRASRQEALIRFSVRDDGPGIPAVDAPRIFERFYRVDKARSRAQGGTGLGLAIAKLIVENHGGVISFVSVERRGAEFSFLISAAA